MPPFWVLEEYEAVACDSATRETESMFQAEYHQQRQMKIPQHKDNNNVQFDCKDTIHVIPGRHELSDFEYRHLWYSTTELSRIGAWNRLTVKRMLFYGRIDDEIHCIRGLENHLKSNELMRDKIRTNSIYAVLAKQSHERQGNQVQNIEEIANAYRTYTRSCTEEAYERGLQDERCSQVGPELSQLQEFRLIGHNSSTTTITSFDDDDLHYLNNLMKDVGLVSPPPQDTVQPQLYSEYQRTFLFDGDGSLYFKDLKEENDIPSFLSPEKSLVEKKESKKGKKTQGYRCRTTSMISRIYRKAQIKSRRKTM